MEVPKIGYNSMQAHFGSFSLALFLSLLLSQMPFVVLNKATHIHMNVNEKLMYRYLWETCVTKTKKPHIQFSNDTCEERLAYLLWQPNEWIWWNFDSQFYFVCRYTSISKSIICMHMSIEYLFIINI